MFFKESSSVWVHLEPVDMRRSFEYLSSVVSDVFSHNIVDGDVYLFLGNNRRRAKVLYFDGTGLVLVIKRLEKGRFQSLASMVTTGSLSMTELSLLFAGSHINFRMELSGLRKAVVTRSSNELARKCDAREQP